MRTCYPPTMNPLPLEVWDRGLLYENYRRTVRRNGKDSKALHYLGLASAKTGDMRAAVKALESAIAIDPIFS